MSSTDISSQKDVCKDEESLEALEMKTQARKEEEPAASTFISPGDHLYRWSSFAGIPGLVQNHAIVSSLNDDGSVVIVDCEALLRGDLESATKTLQRDLESWQLVHYQAGWWRRHLNRSGTCTIVASDPPGLVLARLHFLLKADLPSHHFLKANAECVAVWCKTGTWATLQASSFLHVTAAGQVKSATTLAMYASSQTVAVTTSAGGFWGYLGYTTTSQVPLLSLHPWMLPAIVGYGVVSIGGPVWMLHRAKHAWNETTQRLNDEFWQSAVDHPEEFVESITEWSSFD